MDCKTALQTILDQVDYTSGACRPNEMVGAVLPKEVITLCRQAVEQQRALDAVCTCAKVRMYPDENVFAEDCSVHGRENKQG